MVLLQCTVLPRGERVRVRVSRPTRQQASRALSASLRLTASRVVYLLYSASQSTFQEIVDDVIPTRCHVLLRCMAGGKGGYRKQLEKKGREFAWAKRRRLSSSGKAVDRSSEKPTALRAASSEAAVTGARTRANQRAADRATSGAIDDDEAALIAQLINQGVHRALDG